MAQEERLLILQMVADKKITAAEGVELLRALDAKETRPAAAAAPAPALAPEKPQVSGVTFHMTPPTPPTPPVAPAPPAPPTMNAGANLGSGFASFIEDIVERVSSAFSEVVEPRYEFTYELTGEFPVEGAIPLRIQTGNGKAEIQAWDEPGWKAVILVKARGNNEEDARNRARDAYTVKSNNGFDLEARRHDWTDLAVHVTLFVPRGRRYSVDTRTGNGKVDVKGIEITDGRIVTGNGSLTCTGGSADRLALRSGNGSIDVDGDIADLEAGSGNGSVRVRPTGARPQTFRVNTGNGSVHIDTAGLPADTGFRVEAHTGMGGIHLSVPGLTYERDIRTVGHKQIIARSTNYEQAAVKVAVTARTGMGSVSIG
ncbi:MAG TPA: DUF4097 family beta strand repeat-containing protein [Symbiobacteriaceae bacterium]|nr:DUF4097 family beta strand repeat-containing protein [Symbiobacteriaceae bacterium]